MCNRERNSDSVAKECHRKSSRKRKIVGFLQYNFSDKEKIWRIAPHSKSKQSKSLPAAFPFPNGNPTINYKKPTTGRMDNCIGSDGCLFSCTDPSLPSQISTLLLQRPVLPVQSASVRAFDRSSSVYESSAGDCRTPSSGVYSLSSDNLDDWLLKNKSRSLLLAQAQKAIDVTVKLGFLINKEKSNLRPSQSFVYLGAHFDLKLGRVFLTQERSVLIQDLIGLFRLHEYLPAQTFLKLLGTMASCIDVIPYAHLHMRPIQMYLLFYWKPSQRDVQSLIPVSSQLISHLEWWTIPQNLFKGVPLSPPSPDMVLTTDASKSGWGAHLDDLTVQGVWSSQEQQLHINNLELLAVRNALHHFCTLLQGKHVLVKSDNSTVIAYINNQGGTKSTDLCMILWHLMQWCIEKGITLTSSHIPGVKNTLADVLSRKIFQHTEWSLNDSVLRQIFAIWGSPSIDLFASDNNHKIPVYCSWIPSRRALSGDALIISWSGIPGYAYPPIALLSRVLQKVKQEECTLILIAPLWPKRPWFPLLLDLLIDFPIEIPLLDTLLVQPRTRLYHPAPEVFNLTAWLISSSSLKRKDFLSQLASFWHQQCDRGHRESISTSIDSSYVGVINGMRIPFHAASLQ